MPRSPLPPPPPPAHLRAWPDREALLADRGRAMEVLRGRWLGLGRLAVLWLSGALGALGWVLFTVPLQGLGRYGDRMVLIAAPVLVPLGLGALVAAALLAVRGVRRDREARRLMDAWRGLERDPGTDGRLRAPGLSLAWLLLSFVPCVLGLWASFGAAGAARTVADVVLGMGAGVVLWVTGMLGVAKAFSYRRWVLSRG
ncbi:hypothetical protein I3F58_03560 [Streptomyces sp. MUM 203J]|uniref:hypothetical protein n=1 Tax=Streptomyces sp. MUM 203J TaxID=2791990 RepID=UPI001F036203|nr:hypothetical protein [Streptomyces sp. MUM 203J]MCH0538651.1 hypothetical protein [Streptomyces sp. MUM 203J]